MGTSRTSSSWLHFVGLAAIAVSIGAGLIRYVFIDISDPLHCDALMKEGHWLGAPGEKWQPEGCMLHSYNQNETSACFGSKKIVFIGDSVTRNLFFQFAHTLDPNIPAVLADDGSKHLDHFLQTKDNINMTFYWDPFLNHSRTYDIIASRGSDIPTDDSHNLALLTLGSGLWYLRHANTSGGLRSWEANMEQVMQTLDTNKVKAADRVVLLPVEQVVGSKLSNDRAQSMHPSDIDAMNSYLFHRLQIPFSNASASPPLASPFSTVGLPLIFNKMLDASKTEDGLHFSIEVVKAQADIILNLHCNDGLSKAFPLDKTCCNRYPRPSLLQLLILAAAVLWGPILLAISRRRGQRGANVPWPPEFHASLFSLSLALIFLADRTNMWWKEHKHFSPWTFSFLCLIALASGLVSVRSADKDLGILNREQTDEWKGWMQIAILIYHYCGASKISGIYNPIRVLVASYLFMTGYGHTTFYLKKADFGFLRVAQVMIRLNLVTLLLAYTMNTDYISYYFTPLVSMWYLIIYGTMAIGSQFNDHVAFVVGKITLSATMMTWLMRERWPLETLFVLLRRLCGIRWSAREWSFRVTLDLWIVYVGMLFAIAVIKVREYRLTDHPLWPLIVKVGLIASGLVLLWFFGFELHQESKFTYNMWHPYISFMPVLAFVFLRNANAILRSASSKVFAFVGKCSLETFIIQYHLWLAGDTKGILVIIPGHRWRIVNFILASVMFMYVSDRVAHATTEMTKWICGEPPQPSLPIVAPLPTNAQGSQFTHPEAIPLSSAEKSVGIREPDTCVRNRRWIDRLADGTSSHSQPPGLGIKTRLGIGAGLMWLANIFWAY